MKKKMKTKKKLRLLVACEMAVKVVVGVFVFVCCCTSGVNGGGSGGNSQAEESASAKDAGEDTIGGGGASYAMYGKATMSPKHVIIAAGDGMTEGFLPNAPVPKHPYTDALKKKLNEAVNQSRFVIQNEGFGGTCVFKELLGRLPKILAKEKAKIDLVIILGGAEDIVNSCPLVGDQIIKLHRMVHKAGLLSIVVTIPTRSDDTAKIEFARHKANTKLRVFAHEHRGNTLLCDLAEKKVMRKGKYWQDSIHPTARGYDKMAMYLFKTIRPELEKDGKLF